MSDTLRIAIINERPNRLPNTAAFTHGISDTLHIAVINERPNREVLLNTQTQAGRI